MAGSLNKATLIGHLGRDPEVRTFQNGNRVCNLRVATSESWKDKQTGERQERTEWHSVVLFADGAITFAEKWLAKGSKVYVEGKIETRKWQDQSGADRYSTEIVVRPYGGEIMSLDKLERGERDSRDDDGPEDRKGRKPPPAARNDLDDEIPF